MSTINIVSFQIKYHRYQDANVVHSIFLNFYRRNQSKVDKPIVQNDDHAKGISGIKCNHPNHSLQIINFSEKNITDKLKFQKYISNISNNFVYCTSYTLTSIKQTFFLTTHKNLVEKKGGKCWKHHYLCKNFDNELK